MLKLRKKVLMIVLTSAANLFILTNSTKCVSLKNQECKVRKVIVDNEYMTFPYNIKVDRCTGSCNNITNPYNRACVPSIVKNFSCKVFNLVSQQNETRQIFFHKSCTCDCLLNETACNAKQKWNKDECRCVCLETKKCDIGFVWNVCNCECEKGKKAAKLTTKEECEEINDDVATIKNDILHNKTILMKEIIEDCQPFVV